MTITYNAVESRYDVVKRHTPSTENTTALMKNIKMGMLRNEDNACSHVLPNIDGIRIDLSNTKPSHHVQVKCEPHDNLFLHNQTITSEATNSDIHHISSSTSAEARLGGNTSPMSSIAMPTNIIKLPKVSIKKEFNPDFTSDQVNPNQGGNGLNLSIENNIQKPIQSCTLSRGINVKPEKFEDPKATSSVAPEERLFGRAIKVEPNTGNIEISMVNLKQEPADHYDINLDITSPISTFEEDSIVEPDQDQTSNSTNSFRREPSCNKLRPSLKDMSDKSLLSNSLDELTDSSVSEISQEDAASMIGPILNVIACNEDPSSGCSYLTSSLSSYQVSIAL